MADRLQPLDLLDFTGGFAARRSQFSLADNESPGMLNIEVDPRGGFYTRKGWHRWNEEDVGTVEDWNPRNAVLSPLSTGGYEVYVAVADSDGDGGVFAAGADAAFDNLTVPCNASPHLADFAAWGDTTYMATGHDAAAVSGEPTKRTGAAAVVTLADASLAYNDDYTAPVAGRFPFADFCEVHSGYMFAAVIMEGGVSTEWNRVRWSHPDQPEDWAELDFIDIDRGGGRITGLLSFRDHLLIFKTESIWALYGYDRDTWQLVQVSTTIGVLSPTAFTRNEGAVFFYSPVDSNGIFVYEGGQPVPIHEKVLTIVESVLDHEDVFIGWLGQRLWCSLPVAFARSTGITSDLLMVSNTVLVFDPDTGDGAWVRHAPGAGSLGPFVEGSDTSVQFPLATLTGDSGAACVLQLEFRDDALDKILETYADIIIDGLDGDMIIDGLGGPFVIDGSFTDGHAFFTFYRTGWKHAGWIERRKSWLRPRYVMRIPELPVRVRADTYWDYNEARIRRTSSRYVEGAGGLLWTEGGSGDPDGADWGDPDATWGASMSGGTLLRSPRSLGVARAIQLEVSSDPSTPGRAWGVDAIHLPYNLRRFTT